MTERVSEREKREREVIESQCPSILYVSLLSVYACRLFPFFYPFPLIPRFCLSLIPSLCCSPPLHSFFAIAFLQDRIQYYYSLSHLFLFQPRFPILPVFFYICELFSFKGLSFLSQCAFLGNTFFQPSTRHYYYNNNNSFSPSYFY